MGVGEAPLDAAESRLTVSDKRALLLWIIFGILGVVFAHKYFFLAFPEASIDFKVTQQEALKRATRFVGSLGESVAGYKSTVVFAQDDDAKTYLERELGLQQANQLMSGEVSTWYREVRFFKPLQTEEYLVEISPSGQVVAYNHKMEEAQAGKSLTRDQALDTAKQFLRSKIGTDLDNWNFLPEEASSTARPNRLDWSFTWEKKDFKAKDAPYRMEVSLKGDKIGGQQEFLKVPEEWSRSYQKLRSMNNLYETIALVPYGFLLGGALWLGFGMWRRGQTTWAPAFKIGGLVALLYLLMELNSWNTLLPTYNTQDAYAGFVAQRIFFAVLTAVASGLMVTIVLPGGEPLYRESQPDKLQLYKAFTLRGLRSKEFFSASSVGLALAAAHIGFIVAFYLIGGKLGAWAPQDTNYSEAFNTAIPWIGGVAIGVTAATSEEFLFRLFAIPFLRKFTGSRVLAIILPAFFWGFLHSNYPQEPGYVRGLEVGAIGIVAGLVLMRWGIIATLIWHYTVDASLVGMLLIRSDNLYYKISGIVVGFAAVAPLAWSGIFYLARGRFEPVNDLLNSAVASPVFDLSAPPSTEESRATSRRYTPLTVGMLGFLALCAVLGPLLAWKLKQENIGDYLQLGVNAASAKGRADAVMQQRGLNPASFQSAAELVEVMDPVNNEYLRRRMSIEQINQIYATQVPGVLWRVRYFKDSDPEEFAIVLKPDGSLHAFHHTLAEAAKGLSLDREAAVAIGERFLREEKHIDLGDWKLVADDAKKQPNRTDHTLTWQQNTPLDPSSAQYQPGESADHAYKRMDLSVLGEEPANYRTYIKIPEEFSIKQGQRSLLRTLFGFGKAIMYAIFALGILICYFVRSRGDSEFRVPWRKLMVWGLAGLAAYLVQGLAGTAVSKVFSTYSTATPWKIYLTAMLVGQGIFCALLAGCLVLLYGLLWYFAARAFGKDALPTVTAMPAEYYRDAFFLGLGGAAAFIGVERLLAAASHLWPTTERLLPANVGADFDAIFPGVTAIAGAVFTALFATGGIALAGSFLAAEVRLRAVRLILFLAVTLGFIATWGSSPDFVKHFLQNLLLMAFVVIGISRFVRLNLAGLFLMVMCTALLGGAVPLVAESNHYYQKQGYYVIAVMVVLLAWPAVQWRLRADAPNGMAEPERP
jgi:membrane protease YdiL (CAAX protease family)